MCVSLSAGRWSNDEMSTMANATISFAPADVMRALHHRWQSRLRAGVQSPEYRVQSPESTTVRVTKRRKFTFTLTE